MAGEVKRHPSEKACPRSCILTFSRFPANGRGRGKTPTGRQGFFVVGRSKPHFSQRFRYNSVNDQPLGGCPMDRGGYRAPPLHFRAPNIESGVGAGRESVDSRTRPQAGQDAQPTGSSAEPIAHRSVGRASCPPRSFRGPWPSGAGIHADESKSSIDTIPLVEIMTVDIT